MELEREREREREKYEMHLVINLKYKQTIINDARILVGGSEVALYSSDNRERQFLLFNECSSRYRLDD